MKQRIEIGPVVYSGELYGTAYWVRVCRREDEFGFYYETESPAGKVDKWFDWDTSEIRVTIRYEVPAA